jgi:DNA-binding NtrC family response regulator
MPVPASRPPSQLSVLVIEDEPSRLDPLLQKLGGTPDWSLQLQSASTGEQALQKLKTLAFDLVFLDLALKEAPGLIFLDKLRQLHPKTAVVVTTPGGSEQDAVAAMKKGALDYLPFVELLRSIPPSSSGASTRPATSSTRTWSCASSTR